MDRDNIYNDESMPSDEDVDAMNSAYSIALAPSTRAKIGSFLESAKRRNRHICMPNFDTIVELYAMEKDSVIALMRLRQRARLDTTHATIDDIISIKSGIASYLERLYIKGKKSAMPYTPHIVDRPSYNALYAEIEVMECRLLAKIDTLRLSHIALRAQSAAIMVLSLKI